jgi:tRNA A-37 threonylcarbamoyl transferase component Bud32
MVGLAAGCRYRLLTVVGAGGSATVWRGRDDLLERDVAIKVLRPDPAIDAEVRLRVHREARAVARLSHPHIARVYDYVEAADGDAYVVMEYVDGVPFADRLTDGPVPWREAARLGAEVADAMALAHANGVLHRDIKPANVMVTPDGAKVIDFGISTVVGEADIDPTGAILGTPAYLPPERLSGASASPAGDVYGLGLTLYRAVAGDYPWPLASVSDLLAVHLSGQRPPIPPVPYAPDSLVELCRACLAADPAERPSMTEVTAALMSTLEEPDEVTRPIRSAGPALASTAALPADFFLPPPAPSPLSGILARIPHLSLPGITRIRRLSFLDLAGRPGRAGVSLAAAGAALATLAFLVAVTLTPIDGMGGGEPGAEASMGAAPAVPCTVTYQVEREWNDRVEATLTVSHSGDPIAGTSSLRFSLPDGQTVVGPSSAGWRQDGSDVSAPVPGPWAADSPVTLRLTAKDQSADALPTVFSLGGTACQSTVLAAPQPSETDDEDADAGNSGRGNGNGNGNGNANRGRGNSSE